MTHKLFRFQLITMLVQDTVIGRAKPMLKPILIRHEEKTLEMPANIDPLLASLIAIHFRQRHFFFFQMDGLAGDHNRIRHRYAIVYSKALGLATLPRKNLG